MQPVLSIVMPFAEGMAGRPEINLALACLTAIDVYEIEKYGLPSLYSKRAGVQWRQEFCLAPGVRETCERFLSARKVLEERFGDCATVAPYRAAEHRLRGVRARAIVIPSPGVGWHAVVKMPDGTIEDPSKVLGMGKR